MVRIHHGPPFPDPSQAPASCRAARAAARRRASCVQRIPARFESIAALPRPNFPKPLASGTALGAAARCRESRVRQSAARFGSITTRQRRDSLKPLVRRRAAALRRLATSSRCGRARRIPYGLAPPVVEGAANHAHPAEPLARRRAAYGGARRGAMPSPRKARPAASGCGAFVCMAAYDESVAREEGGFPSRRRLPGAAWWQKWAYLAVPVWHESLRVRTERHLPTGLTRPSPPSRTRDGPSARRPVALKLADKFI